MRMEATREVLPQSSLAPVVAPVVPLGSKLQSSVGRVRSMHTVGKAEMERNLEAAPAEVGVSPALQYQIFSQVPSRYAVAQKIGAVARERIW